MQFRPALVAVVLLTLSVAGCFGGGDEAGVIDNAGTNATDPNTKSPEGRGRIVAFEETNQTEEGAGGVDHHHDYWAGRSRVTVFEQYAKMKPMKSTEAVEYEAQATFEPIIGALIYEGTATVEFTITNPQRHACEGEDTINGDYACTDNFIFNLPNADDPAPPTGLKLRYKHASTNDWIDVGELTWDQPATIRITNPIQTDMPHATSSLWRFQVISPHKQDQTLVFTAKADLVRSEGEIPLWPGHPNFYTTSDSRVVLDTQAVAGDPGAYGHGAAIVPSEVGYVSPDKLISYGTKTLYVWVNITEVTAPNPLTAPSTWFLFHLNATGRENITNPSDEDNHPASKMEHFWIFPVDDTGMDSPYSDASRWQFKLGGNFDFLVLSGYADYANWAAKYNIKIVASSVELPHDQYTYYCLRNAECPTPPAAS